MPTKLPYVVSPASLRNALDRIQAAATPPRFTTDFVTAVLKIKGGTGNAIAPFMKRIGFVASDGTPTDLYKRFRNPTVAGSAVADAIRSSYGELASVNEYFFKLADKDLRNLILQVTGLDHDNRVAAAIFATLKALMHYADFDSQNSVQHLSAPSTSPSPAPSPRESDPVREQFSEVANGSGVGLNLAYTINLNLPATTDQAVFNAIFKSLREHLLSSNE